MELVPDAPDLPMVVGEQQALIPFIVTVDPPPDDAGPTDTDWHGAESLDWEQDEERKRIHWRGVRAYRLGTLALWVTCDCAYKIVGRYSRGATSAFATDIARSVSTVENMAHASALYFRLLREFGGGSEDDTPNTYLYLVPKLRAIRRKLSYTHFAEMWALWKSDPQMTALAVFGELETAAANGISSRALKDSGAGQQGKTAVVVALHGLRSSYIRDLVKTAKDQPADTYVVIVQGDEWIGVEQVKVRPA